MYYNKKQKEQKNQDKRRLRAQKKNEANKMRELPAFVGVSFRFLSRAIFASRLCSPTHLVFRATSDRA